MKLLIVEDSEFVRGRIVGVLAQDSRLVITVAGTVADAIAALDSEPDVVSVDLHMPDGSGLDAIKHARTLRRPPLIYVLTAVPDMTEPCLKAGANIVFDKLDDMSVYLNTIRNQVDAFYHVPRVPIKDQPHPTAECTV